MDVKQEPFDMHKKIKNEPDEVAEPQTRGQFVGVEIKEEIINCEVPKTEKLPDLSINMDYDTVDKNIKFISTIKKELDDINDFREVKESNLFVHISDMKREIGEDAQVKIESELLATYCDLPTLKDEGTDYMNYFAQPCSSKQTQPLKNRTSKVARKKKRLYPCPVCRKNFPSSKSRSTHFDGHFWKRFVVCEFCGKLMTKTDFLQHYFIHVMKNRTKNVSQKNSKVSNIKSAFINNTQLKNYSTNHTKDQFVINSLFSIELEETVFEPFKCDICFIGFKYKYSLERHYLVIHSREKPLKYHKTLFKCDICSKIFKKKFRLKAHLKRNTNKKIYKCNNCSKTFIYKCSLKQHFKIHINDEPFKCDICLKGFNVKDELQQHIILHINEKSFKCYICSKEFKYKCLLLKHLTIHSDLKPFKCDVCSRKFNRKANLQQHLKTHTNKKLKGVTQIPI